MKLSEIITQLAFRLPQYTPKFSALLSVSTAGASNGLVTVVSNGAHGMATGNYVLVGGIEVLHSVTSTEIKNGELYITLASDHDLTEDFDFTAKITGANQSAYNGTFLVERVPNRRTFSIDLPVGQTTVPTGTLVFHEFPEYGYNAPYPITVVNSTTFTFQLPNNFTQANLNLTIARGQRIIGVPDLERAYELYTREAAGNYYAYVAMEIATVSKDRLILSDALANVAATTDVRQLLIEPFSVYVFTPTTETMSAVPQIDDCYSEIRNAMLKSLVGLRFDSDLTGVPYSGAYLTGHGLIAYTKSLYIHQYRFETTKEITFDDSAASDIANNPSRAFRDIYFTMSQQMEYDLLTDHINLDDEPLES
jgi:hypothetical protein